MLSILFTAILLFSLCGYRLVIDLLQRQANHTMIAAISAESYPAENLISLKVPVALPYYTNSEQFQQVRGEVTIDGTVYQFIKSRIYHDSIEYLCLPDPASTRLQGARDQFFQLAYDLQAYKQGKAKQNSLVKPLLLEYCAQTDEQEAGWLLETATFLRENDITLKQEPGYAFPGQPPEQGYEPTYC